ncbi:MAG: CoA ester lyase [Candidatus Latescibacteria bacterium]|nr:CoA ester lyase [Candidatus Latescibacterota bacterium]
MNHLESAQVYLYVPANDRRKIEKAAQLEPDALIFDLEDSVPPGEKEQARVVVNEALKHHDYSRCVLVVRINPGGSGKEDILALDIGKIDAVMIPKCEQPDDVTSVEQVIRMRTTQEICILPLIETARGVVNIEGVLSASHSICAVALGGEDLVADIGAVSTKERKELLYARSQLVLCAAAYNVAAIDTPFVDMHDEHGLKTESLDARRMGFAGKQAIHPSQIAPIREAFSPTRDEIDEAERIVSAFEEAFKKGTTVIAMNGKMIDPPVVARARRILALAQRER